MGFRHMKDAKYLDVKWNWDWEGESLRNTGVKDQ